VGREALACLLIFITLHGGVIQDAYAPHYDKGLMARVAARRDMQPQACMISSAQYGIGEWVWVFGKRTGALLHCQVIDVSQTRHKKGHIARLRLIELDYAVTRQLCGTVNGSSAECPVTIIKLGE
jgi:hypothetical protein